MGGEGLLYSLRWCWDQGPSMGIALAVHLNRLSLQHPSRQPARNGKVGGSRRVGASSETKRVQIQTNTYINPAAAQQRWRSTASGGTLSVLLPPGQQARQKAEGVGPLLLSMHAYFRFSAKVRHSRQHNTREATEQGDTVGNIIPEKATEQSIGS